MKRSTSKAVLAGVIAAAGLIVAGRAVVRLTRPTLPPEHRDFPDHSHSEDTVESQTGDDHTTEAAAQTTELQRTLKNATWITPTAQELDALALRVGETVDRAIVRLHSRAVLNSERRRDLVGLFQKTFRLWQAPSVTKEEYVDLVESRGGRPTLDPDTSTAAPGYLDYSLSDFSTDQIDVVPRYIGGRLETPWPDGAGPGWTFYNPDMFDMPDDPRRGRLDVYEVRIPVKAPALNFETGEEGRVPLVLGFAYAWDEERREWIPWRHWLYMTSEDRRAGWAPSALGLP